ncbi:MAG TPA: DUF4124 domain-containing protein [Gammaproteobacteria bacterium]|nr:DUF4124 domain-containing protein [Gammaproteobacteria bacterium]
MWGTNNSFRVIARLCLLTAALAATATFVTANAANGPKVYKWVDSKGVVHYGDQVPPQYSRQKREVINQQGLVVDVLPAQETPEELAAQRKHRQAAKALAEQHAHDQMLLNAYRSVSDIESARDNHVGAIAARINITTDAIQSLREQLNDMQQQATKQDPVSPELEKQIEELKAQLAGNQQALAEQKAQMAEIEQNFAVDIKRFKALKAAGDEGSSPSANAGRNAQNHPRPASSH